MQTWRPLLELAMATGPGVALAQLRPQREPVDWSSAAVVLGLLVLGVVALLLARGTRR
jgi:hypothetical protein